MSANSTGSPRGGKAALRPPKPYPDFPLYPHPLGYWSKKVNGTICHFGRWGRVVNGQMVWVAEDGDWAKALKLFNAQKDDLYADRKPRIRVNKDGELEDDEYRVKHLCDSFLVAKQRKVESGEIGVRMFQEYREITDLLVANFGNRPVDDLDADDFETLRATLAKRWGPVRLANAITRIKSVFKYGFDNGKLDKPTRFGTEFRKPDKAVLRRHRAERGEKMLEAGQLRSIIKAAPASLKAAILLGVNSAFGNHDIASLPLSALDLDSGWITFARPKTGIERRCPLWPETVAALREAISLRPTPRDSKDNEIVLLMDNGRRWVRNTEKSRTDNLSVVFGTLLKEVKAHRTGIGFYTLRHIFRTVADAARDPVAIDLIMGHADPSMGGHYRERIDDTRLLAVTDHVRRWLFGSPDKGESPNPNHETDWEEAAKSMVIKDKHGKVVHKGEYVRDEIAEPKNRPSLRLYVG